MEYLNHPLPPETITFVDIIRQRAENQADSIAYIFLQNAETNEIRLNYRELDQYARRIATQLQHLGARGDRALLIYPPGLEFITAFFGCLYAGVVAVPAYPPRPNQRLNRLQAIVADAQSTFALTTTSVFTSIQQRITEDPELAALHWVTTDNIDHGVEQNWQIPSINHNTLAFLQYTSGSTGTPKGVMVNHDNLIHNSELIYQCFGHTPNSQGLIWLPPYHDMGLIGGIIQPLYGGFPVTLMSPMAFLQKPLRWLQAISRYQATTSGGPNFAYELCIRKITPEQCEYLDLSSWEVAFNGAEPIRAEILEQFTAKFASCGFRPEAFYPCYGMAETTLIVTGGLKTDLPVILSVDQKSLQENRVIIVDNGQKDSQKVVGCGWTWLNGKVVIVDPDALTLCAEHQVGEIWVSSTSVASGYWQRVEQTQTTFNAYLADIKSGSFLRTGDLGFLHKGELFITGRLKDVIIIRGRNYYPQDIELTVASSHPALAPGAGAAFAVEVNGQERLVIVQEVARAYLRKLNINEVNTSIRRALSAEYGLETYAVVLLKTGSIPKTSSGKIQRHACQVGFLTGSLDVINDQSENIDHEAEIEKLDV